MKRKIFPIFILVLIVAFLTSCGKTQNSTNQKNKNKVKMVRNEDYGFEYGEPEFWGSYIENEKLSFTLLDVDCVGSKNDSIKMTKEYNFLYDVNGAKKLFSNLKENSSQEEIDKVSKEYKKLLKPVCEILVVDRNVKDKTQLNNEFSKYDLKEKLASRKSFDYYLLYNKNYDNNNLTEDAKKVYNQICSDIKVIKDTFKTFDFMTEEERIARHKDIKFKAKTIDNREIDSSIFKNSKLTMINIWATFCGPCVEEMPDLQKLYEEVKSENINVIGIAADVQDEDTQLLAKQIIEKRNVKFINIIPDDNLKNGILKDIKGYPTTIFVDSNGNIVGDYILGSADKDYYKNQIKNVLKNLK